MDEVSLSQILEARDNRVMMQKHLIDTYKKPVISFTMNIAGPKKISDIIKRAFYLGIEKLSEHIHQDKILFSAVNIHITGCEAFMSVDIDSARLKQICEAIEDENDIGRLFDFDVINAEGIKLCREKMRGCIVCKAPGRACAAGRLHSVEEISDITEKIINAGLFENDKKRIARLASDSLIKEVYTTPKPGLVDCNNSGSHTDMNLKTFVASANALNPYFAKCFDIGQRTRDLSPSKVFAVLKSEGICAEKAMYCATNGANTHKGIIYSMGIICASIGRLWKANKPYAEICNIADMSSLLSASATEADFKNTDSSTAGMFCYHNYGIKGIRGEVLSGFPSVIDFALPLYISALEGGLSENDAGVFTLIHLISRTDDTNLYHRGGADGAKYASDYASSLVKDTAMFSTKAVEKMDDEFIRRNLSPGGCADLLAITYFFHSLNKYRSEI